MTGPLVEIAAKRGEDFDRVKAAAEKMVAELYPDGATTCIDTFESAERARTILDAWCATTPAAYEPSTDHAARVRNSAVAIQHAMALGTAAHRLIVELSMAADRLQVGGGNFLRLTSAAAASMGGGLCPAVLAIRDASSAPETAPGGDA